MIICFGWKFHEILLNTVYLRKLSDVDAVDVRVLHNAFNVSHCGAQTSFRMSYVSAFLKPCDENCFGTKIVLLFFSKCFHAGFGAFSTFKFKVSRRQVFFWAPSPSLATFCLISRLLLKLAFLDSKCNIGLFKMFSRWILHIFTAQIQSE